MALMLLVFCWQALAGVPVDASQSLKPDAATENELRALRQRLFDGLKRGDKARLEELLAEGFVFIHSTGVLERRADFIAERRRGPGERAERRRVSGGRHPRLQRQHRCVGHALPSARSAVRAGTEFPWHRRAGQDREPVAVGLGSLDTIASAVTGR
jgi:hypothetical protein